MWIIAHDVERAGAVGMVYVNADDNLVTLNPRQLDVPIGMPTFNIDHYTGTRILGLADPRIRLPYIRDGNSRPHRSSNAPAMHL